MAILGLLLHETDTVAGVGQRLERRFPGAHFARSAAHNALPSLERQGLVRMVEASAGRAPDRYALTAQGRRAFRRWLHDAATATPALRDGLHAKLALAEREDLPHLTRAARDAERRCAEEYAAAHARLVAAEILSPAGGEGLGGRLAHLILADEATIWLLQVKRLQRLRAALEPLADDSSEPGPTRLEPPSARSAAR
jgi:DNA-binding PadR family transcriptional regulator